MVKTQLFFIIATISGFLLTLQLITLQIIVNRSKPESNTIWRTLFAVTTIASQNELNLILVDRDLLKKSFPPTTGFHPHESDPSTPSSTPYCNTLCQGQKVTHLAALSELSNSAKLIKVKKQLEDKGYTVMQLMDMDESSSQHSLHFPTTNHMIVLDQKVPAIDGHVIHVSFLHEQLSHWVRGPMDLTETQQRLIYRQGVRKSHFSIHDHSTIYPKVEIKPAIIDGVILNVPLDTRPFTQSKEFEYEFIPCNMSGARDFKMSNHKMEEEDKEKNRLFRSKVKHILSETKIVLDKLKVPFWISSGTLLGYYRQCDVMHYSMDVDIGIRISDYHPNLISEMSMNDLPLIHQFGRINDSFELSFRDEHIKLDIFFFYIDRDHPGHVYNGGTDTQTGYKYKYSFESFTFCWTNFLEMMVLIPCPTLPYIKANYGNDWFRPNKVWDWKMSPPNVQHIGQWAMNDWHQVIRSFPVPEFP